MNDSLLAFGSNGCQLDNQTLLIKSNLLSYYRNCPSHKKDENHSQQQSANSQQHPVKVNKVAYQHNEEAMNQINSKRYAT